MRELDELLEAWPDDEETSDVRVEEFHYHAPSISDNKSSSRESQEVTKRYDLEPKEEVTKRHQPSFGPQAKRITAIIIAVAAGIAGAVKILWEVYSNLKK